MANMLRVGFLSRFSARAVGRRIHTSAPRKFDPVPIARQEAGTELQALLTKEKGPWNQLSKDEKLSLYKAQFPKTLAELREGEPYMKKMVGGLSALLAASVVFFVFLRKYVGPEAPRTINPEWRAASIEKMKRQKTNPISGVSSKQ